MNGAEVAQAVALRRILDAIYADTRFPRPTTAGDLRHFTATLAWVTVTVPAGQRWKRFGQLMHYEGDPLGDFTFWQMIGEDAPRYQPEDWRTPGRGCAAPMLRRAGLCGQRGNNGFRVTDPATGRWRMVEYCRRHAEDGRQAYAAERRLRASGQIPEPMPNTGGLLPCYIGAKWPDLYARASSSWRPPSMGICADDWPTLARVIPHQAPPPKFRIIDGDRVSEAPPLPAEDDDTAPRLRLVPTETHDQPEDPDA